MTKVLPHFYINLLYGETGRDGPCDKVREIAAYLRGRAWRGIGLN